MGFMETLRERVRGKGVKVVYPEGLEERAIRAAGMLRDADWVRPVSTLKQAERCAIALLFGT